MARKEDMLPPGWEDLDRYVDLLFRLHVILSRTPHRDLGVSSPVEPFPII